MSTSHLELPTYIDLASSFYYKTYFNFLYWCAKNFYIEKESECEDLASCKAINFLLRTIKYFTIKIFEVNNNFNYANLNSLCSFDKFKKLVMKQKQKIILNNKNFDVFDVKNNVQNYFKLSLLVYVDRNDNFLKNETFNIWKNLYIIDNFSNFYTSQLKLNDVDFYLIKPIKH